MMYNFCKIVQDLLPNYMEKITFDETNQFIKEHLEQCEECTKIYNNMKSNLEVPIENIDKEVDYMKKINKEVKHLKFWKKVLIVIALIIGILAGIVLYRYSILTNLYNLEIKYSKSENVYLEEKRENSVLKIYKKNNVMKVIKGGTSDTVIWRDLNTGETYMIFENTKQYSKLPADSFLVGLPSSNNKDTIIKRLKLALDMEFSIKTIKYNNKDCYKTVLPRGGVNYDRKADFNLESIYEKSTGLPLFYSEPERLGPIGHWERDDVYLTWDIGNVTDEQIAKPDLSQYEYKKIRNVNGVTGEVTEY